MVEPLPHWRSGKRRVITIIVRFVSISNSQSLKRINLQNLRIYPSTLYVNCSFTPLKPQSNQPSACPGGGNAAAGTSRGSSGKRKSACLGYRNWSSGRCCVFPMFSYGPFRPCQKPRKMETQKWDVTTKQEWFMEKNMSLTWVWSDWSTETTSRKPCSRPFQWRWFSMGWWLSCPEK